jgi:hypothetical protein
MNTGNSVRDADPRFAVNADVSTVEAFQESPGLAATGHAVTGNEVPDDEESTARTRPSFHHVQDIQELIDKIAAVTKQLRHPGQS